MVRRDSLSLEGRATALVAEVTVLKMNTWGGTVALLAHVCTQSLLKLMSIESVMPSNHLILSQPLLLPTVFPSVRVFHSVLLLLLRFQSRKLRLQEAANLEPEPGLSDARPWLAPSTLSWNSLFTACLPLWAAEGLESHSWFYFTPRVPCVKTCLRSE